MASVSSMGSTPVIATVARDFVTGTACPTTAEPGGPCSQPTERDEIDYLTEDLEAIRAQTREYVEKEIVPNAGPWWEDGGVPPRPDDMGRLGSGLRIPEEHGGIGLGALASVMFARSWAARRTAGSQSRCWCTPTSQSPTR